MTTSNKNGLSTANLLFEATQYFVNNLNAGLTKLESQYEKIDKKINTPPRNEELEAGQRAMDKKIDTMLTLLAKINDALKSTLLYIKIFATAISIAIIVGGIISYYNTRTININQLEQRVEQLEKNMEQYIKMNKKRIELLEKEYGITHKQK